MSAYTSIPLFPLSLGRDSTVGIRYGLDGPGIESWWGRDFLRPSKPALGSTKPPIKWLPGLLSGGKVAGSWTIHPHLAPRLKED